MMQGAIWQQHIKLNFGRTENFMKESSASFLHLHNRLLKKIVLILATGILLLIYLCAKEKNADPWSPQIENLEWGMSIWEIQEHYPFAIERVTDRVQYLSSDKELEIYGVPMHIVLSVDNVLGLVNVTGTFEEKYYDMLEEKLQTGLSAYRIGEQPSNGISWKSESAMHQYQKDDLMNGYRSVLGENVVNEAYIMGILGSPLVSCELRKQKAECRFTVNAKIQEELKYIKEGI